MALRDYTITLGAGAEQVLTINGNFFLVVQATGLIQLTFDDQPFISRGQGANGTYDYTRVKVYSPIAQTVILGLGTGRAEISGSLNATVNTPVEPANLNVPLAVVSVGAGATVLLAAADANRVALDVTVKSTAANGVHYGDVTVGVAAPGAYVEEGSSVLIPSEAAIYAYNPGGAAVDVYCTNLRRL